MPCVVNNTFTTLPSYSVNLVCHLPLHRGGFAGRRDVDPYDVSEAAGETAGPYNAGEHSSPLRFALRSG
ncbi:MAG: hypothetical protein IKV43_03200 [Clostridia bacterium]|nr:hypothetical protein [Clostridia bacterium]